MVNGGHSLRLALRPAPPRPPVNPNAPSFEPGKPWTGAPGMGFEGIAHARSASPPGDGFHPHHLIDDCKQNANSSWAGKGQIAVAKKMGKNIRRFNWSLSALVMYEKDPKPRYMPCKLSPGLQGPLLVVPKCTASNAGHCVSMTLPAGQLSHEMFTAIAEMVSRDDLKNLRLVNKEFERHVSSTYYNTTVVPFTTEVYDVTVDDAYQSEKSKGKKRARDARDINKDVGTPKSGTTGLRLFQSYGNSMLKFAVAFEVTEDQLCGLPATTKQEALEAYHGGFSWPADRNLRYPTLLALQVAAEEDSRMKAALSHLENVNELGLCADGGLGWLSGQDVSVRGRIFSRPSKVFRSSLASPDNLAQGAAQLWSAILRSQWEIAGNRDLKNFDLLYRELDASVKKRLPAKLPQYADDDSWHPLQKKMLPESLPHLSSSSGYESGFLIGSNTEPVITSMCTQSPLVPSDLTDGQKEWLLQATWAQDAFVATYRLAIINNPAIAARVTTLNIARLSSGLLHNLGLENLLHSITALVNLKIMISPDWQIVGRDDFEVTQVTHTQPTQAVPSFQAILNSVARKKSVQYLCVGWLGGGEHAEGMFARNAHVMPAPILIGQDLHGPIASAHLPAFPHVKHLTFVNCWFSPLNLESFIKLHQDLELEKLTLDSVSLTADTSVPRSWLPVLEPLTNQRPELWKATVFNRISPHNYYSLLSSCRYYLARRLVAAPSAAPGPPPPPPAGTHWSQGMRNASWPSILGRVSPGPALDDYLVPDAEPAQRVTKLAELELISCGYIRLDHTMPFSQEEVGASPSVPDTWFTSRGAHLSDKVLPQTDTLLGWIVQWMPEHELLALRNAWGLREGWTDAEKAEQATYDGLLPGGTGRVSGVIKKGMGLYQ